MFNLEQSISDWRRQMLAAGVRTPVPLEELETHLREEIATLQASGHDESAAFHTATQKLGPAPVVQTEFKKLSPANSALTWQLFASLFAGFTLLFPALVACLAFVTKDGVFADLTPGQRLSSAAAAFVFSLLAWSTRLSHETIPALRSNRTRDAIFVHVMLWLVAFAYVIMPHVNLAPEQKSVISLWGLAPFGIILGWCWGFAATNRKNLMDVTA